MRAIRRFGGQEVLVVFDNIFIPWDHVLMDGECEFAQELVACFTARSAASSIHRAVCRTSSSGGRTKRSTRPRPRGR